MKSIQTEVKEVQIYRHGCTAVRQGKVQLEAGTNQVLIAGLTASSYIDTLRLHFPADISASAVHVMTPDHKDGESEEIADQIAAAQEQIDALKKQAEMWQNTSGFAMLQNATIDQAEKYINAYPERLKLINAKVRSLEKEKKKLNEKLNQVYDQENRPLISALLTAETAGEYPFEMTYQENAASWDSKYEIHTDAKGPLELRFKAEVRQKTGEDWKGVRVSLRTGTPVRSANLPDLDPVYLDFEEPRKNMVFGAAPRMMKATAMYDMEEAVSEDTALLKNLSMPEAAVEVTSTMTEYTCSSVYDIQSAKDGMYIDLQNFEIPAEYIIKAVPKEDIRAYLLACVNTADLPMMIHGNASVYLEGIYSGTAYVNPDYAEETYLIALGTEERIRLSRSARKKKASEALLRNQQSAVYEFDIQVVNGKEEEADVSVSDQIPLSREQGITVETVSLSSAVYDSKTGKLEWKCRLAPHETKNLHVEYRVLWPKDKSVTYFEI